MTSIFGTSGADTLTSGAGADSISAGAGNDSIVWSNAGSDTIDGGAGADTLKMGIGVSHQVSITGVTGHAQIVDIPPGASTTPPGGPVAMVIGGSSPPPIPSTLSVSNVEQVNFVLGTDTPVTINNLLQSGVSNLNFSISRFFGATGADVFQFNAGATSEEVDVFNTNTSADLFVREIDSSSRFVTTEIGGLTHADNININGSAGADGIVLDGLLSRTALSPVLNVNAGDGADTIRLAPWVQVNAGAGDDFISWVSSTVGYDTVDGGAGNDTLSFNTDGGASHLSISGSASGQLVLQSANTDTNVTATNVETLNIESQSGSSLINVADLTATAVRQVNLDLGTFTGDTQQDIATVNGSARSELVTLRSTADNTFSISGLPEGVKVTSAGAGDTIAVNTGAGDDYLDASLVTSGKFAVSLQGGDGNDTLIASDVATTLIGGNGSDQLRDAAHNSTIFAFNAHDTGSDLISFFRTSGPQADVIQLDQFRFAHNANFTDFWQHYVVSDGHGGTDVIDDSGHVVVDIVVTAPNLFSSQNFLFH